MSKDIDHTSRDHALLSPSGSHRWLKCTPSARLEEHIPGSTSAAAEEGTVAHELSEYALDKYIKGEYIPLLDELPVPKEIAANKYYSSEMDNCVTDYVCYVCDIFEKMEGAKMYLERKFDLTSYVNDCFGSCDCAIEGTNILNIIDLKYGKGVRVEAKDNTQLMMYALGVLRSLSPKRQAEIETIKMHIAQVRLGNYEVFEMPARDLTHWGIHKLRPTAEKAWSGQGNAVVGSHCKFCKFKPQCRAQRDALVNEFETHRETKALTLDEIGDILSKADMFTDWLSSVKSHAMAEALSGKTVKGWKLVEGRANRVIADEDEAVKRLSELGFEPDSLKNHKLKGIVDLENMVGKKTLALTLDGIIIKPKGAPTLVLESDKREAIQPTIDTFDKLNS
nr:MAG TPA: Protein of unknown function (DUF2800) [Bacteriophage sp.]